MMDSVTLNIVSGQDNQVFTKLNKYCVLEEIGSLYLDIDNAGVGFEQSRQICSNILLNGKQNIKQQAMLPTYH